MFSRFSPFSRRISRCTASLSLFTAVSSAIYYRSFAYTSAPTTTPTHIPSDDIIRDSRTPRAISLPENKLASLFPLVPHHRLKDLQMSDVGQYSITKDLSVLDHFFSDIIPSHLLQDFLLQRLQEADNDNNDPNNKEKNPSKNRRLRVVDATGGMGGSSMYFLSRGCDVIAFEVQPSHCSMLKNNLSVFREALIESKAFDASDPPSFSVRCENFADALLSKSKSSNELKGDILVVEPPWGGPEVMTQRERLINVGLGDLPLSEILNQSIAKDRFRLAMIALPPLFDYSRLMDERNNNLIITSIPWRNYSYAWVWKIPPSLPFPHRMVEKEIKEKI